MQGEECKIVCLKILGGFGCALAMVLPFAALLAACCGIAMQAAKDVAEEAGPAIFQGLIEETKQAALADARAAGPPIQSKILVSAIGMGGTVPGPAAVLGVARIDLHERSVQQVKAEMKDQDPDFIEKLYSAFSVVALFNGGKKPGERLPDTD
jgi:hypothetical protein